MKNRLYVFVVLFIFSLSLNAQELIKQKNLGELGVTFSTLGKNDVVRKPGLYGAPGYSGNYFYTIGINYIRSLTTLFDFETGFEYSKQSITIKPNLPPGWGNTPYHESFSLLSIPLSLRINFLKYFFANGGVLFDIDAGNSHPIDSQAGIGDLFGLGAKYDFGSGASVFINPFVKFHSILPFSPEKYQQKLNESGIRIGITFDLSKSN